MTKNPGPNGSRHSMDLNLLTKKGGGEGVS